MFSPQREFLCPWLFHSCPKLRWRLRSSWLWVAGLLNSCNFCLQIQMIRWIIQCSVYDERSPLINPFSFSGVDFTQSPNVSSSEWWTTAVQTLTWISPQNCRHNRDQVRRMLSPIVPYSKFDHIFGLKTYCYINNLSSGGLIGKLPYGYNYWSICFVGKPVLVMTHLTVCQTNCHVFYRIFTVYSFACSNGMSNLLFSWIHTFKITLFF